MSSPKKAIIIGGGIAGPAAALFLQQVGIHSEIYEARDEAETHTGWFLNLAGNGIEVLKLLGIDASVAAEGSPVPRMVMWNARGKRLGEVRNGAREGLTTSIIIRRSALQQVLYEAARDHGIPVHFGKRLQDIETGGTAATAVFDGGTRATGDLIVGADGIHSWARQFINPSAPLPTYTGLISTGGFCRLPQLPPTTDTQHFIFGKRAFFGYHVLASGEVYWFNNHGYAGTPSGADLRGIKSGEWKQRLLEMHRDDLPLINQIIGATSEGIGAFPIYDIATQPIWSRGPVVLLGDAIHAVSPSSGQGASLALEDAAVLAACIASQPDLTAAFIAYDNLRRERVERMVAWARSLGGAKLVTNPIQVWFRDLLMPLFLRQSANPEALDWIYAYQVPQPERKIEMRS